MDSCTVLKNILEVYEKSSGQQVNFSNSAITFSHNVDRRCRKDVQQILGLVDGSSYDKYLGLPTMVGKNRRNTFNFLREKVWKRVNGWKESLYSAGGKEVLVKAVARAIPTYTMCIFQLPKQCCADLSCVIIGFWWGSSSGKRKIHWVSKEVPFKPKSAEGLGFIFLLFF